MQNAYEIFTLALMIPSRSLEDKTVHVYANCIKHEKYLIRISLRFATII